ncbi:hypothetical protein ACET3Z_011483 [Daucus carota]
MPRDCNDRLQGNDVLEEVSGPTMHDVTIHFDVENRSADDASWNRDDVPRLQIPIDDQQENEEFGE